MFVFVANGQSWSAEKWAVELPSVIISRKYISPFQLAFYTLYPKLRKLIDYILPP